MPRSLVSKVTAISIPFLLVLAFGVVNAIRNLTTLRGNSHHVTDHVLGQIDASGSFLIHIQHGIAEIHELDRPTAADALADLDQTLVALRADLATLGEEESGDQFDPAFNAEDRLLQQRRQALFSRLEGLLATARPLAGQAGNPALAAVLEELEELEEEATQLSADTTVLTDRTIAQAREELTAGTSRAQYTAPVVLTMFAVIMLISIWWLRTRVARPLGALAAQADAVAGGQLDQEVAVTSDDEIGGLQRSFGAMIANLRGQRAAIEQRTAELEASLEAQGRLVSTVQQLTTPLLPVLEGVVVLPILGHLDAERARALTATLLEGVARQRARMAILDITGLATVDAAIVARLIETMQAVELLGAKAALAGISAEMARLMVSQNVNLQSLATYADLRTAIEVAIGGAAGRD
ncbi:MAG TPA: HAMP domain-containing protein [Herpetosiphonaceae bacterium]